MPCFAQCNDHRRLVLDPGPIDDLRAYLDHVAQQWDNALARLKALAEGQ